MAAILVVEDELNIRLMLTTILRQQQHEVTEAQDGLEALNHLEHASMFDLVITDVRMPKLDGLELLAIVQRDYPTTPVIVMSAYQDRLIEASQYGAIPLPKPFSYKQVIDTVRGTLNN